MSSPLDASTLLLYKHGYLLTYFFIGIVQIGTYARYYHHVAFTNLPLVLLGSYFFTAMTLWCHLVCVFADPGYLGTFGHSRKDSNMRASVVSDIEMRNYQVFNEGAMTNDRDSSIRDLSTRDVSITMSSTVCHMSCQQCGANKANAAYESKHCKVCDHCVLVRDHHCAFIGNCIGLKNFKAFILFNVYLFILCQMVTALLLHNFYSVNTLRKDEDGLISISELFTNKLQLKQNLMLEKPLKLVDDLLATVTVSFGVFALVMGINTMLHAYKSIQNASKT